MSLSQKTVTAPRFVVTEGVSSTFFYHLSPDGKPTRGLCGAQTMHTSIQLHTWGYKGHLNERYCAECEKLATMEGAAFPATRSQN